jgi:hypothetical protein
MSWSQDIVVVILFSYLLPSLPCLSYGNDALELATRNRHEEVVKVTMQRGLGVLSPPDKYKSVKPSVTSSLSYNKT